MGTGTAFTSMAEILWEVLMGTLPHRIEIDKEQG